MLRRVELRDARERQLRGTGAALLLEREAEAEQRVHVVRIADEQLPVGRNRRVEQVDARELARTARALHVGERAERGRVRRIELERALELGRGIVEVAPLPERDPQVVVVLGDVAVERDRALHVRDGRIEVAPAAEHDAEQVQ